MNDEDILARIKEAKEFADKAFNACVYIFENNMDDRMLEAIDAVEGTATDLSYEAWDLKMEFWIALGKITRLGEVAPSLMGTRKIPDVP